MNTDYQRQEDVEQGNITRRFVFAIVWGLFAQIMPVLHVFSVVCVLLACWHAWQVVLLRCCAERREERGEIYVWLAYGLTPPFSPEDPLADRAKSAATSYHRIHL